MIEFLDHILKTYADRPVRIAVAQEKPRYAPFGWWELADGIIEKTFDLSLRRDVFISPKFGDKYVFQVADLDGGLPQFDKIPDYLTKTSENHYQAIWLIEPVDYKEWKKGQNMLRVKYKSDTGNSPKYVARIPGSHNFKRGYKTEVL